MVVDGAASVLVVAVVVVLGNSLHFISVHTCTHIAAHTAHRSIDDTVRSFVRPYILLYDGQLQLALSPSRSETQTISTRSFSARHVGFVVRYSVCHPSIGQSLHIRLSVFGPKEHELNYIPLPLLATAFASTSLGDCCLSWTRCCGITCARL